MNVWDHLGELRRRFLICIASVAICMVAGFWTVNPILDWLARPLGTLIYTEPFEAFGAQVKIAVGVGFLIALPVLLYQFWVFISLGLTNTERKSLRWLVPSSYVLFLGGFSFSSFLLFPRAVAFVLTLGSQHVEPMLSIGPYLDMFCLSGLVLGFLFQLPLVLYFMARVGLLQASSLAKNRKVTYLVIFIAASVLNPGPDAFTQILLAAAAILLFEISIWVVRTQAK